MNLARFRWRPNPDSKTRHVEQHLIRDFVERYGKLPQPTPTARATWGQVKARYAPGSGPVLQVPTNK